MSGAARLLIDARQEAGLDVPEAVACLCQAGVPVDAVMYRRWESGQEIAPAPALHVLFERAGIRPIEDHQDAAALTAALMDRPASVMQWALRRARGLAEGGLATAVGLLWFASDYLDEAMQLVQVVT